MPEQPADPRHYDMRIPPPPDPSKQHQPEKPSADEAEAASNTVKDTHPARGENKDRQSQNSK
jgi:hypothetical protein